MWRNREERRARRKQERLERKWYDESTGVWKIECPADRQENYLLWIIALITLSLSVCLLILVLYVIPAK